MGYMLNYFISLFLFALISLPIFATEKQEIVVLEYGTNINEDMVNTAIRVLQDRGCNASKIYRGKLLFNTVKVIYGDESQRYRNPADAAGWALEKCQDVSEQDGKTPSSHPVK
ncbi:hypothetical protein [Alteromonas sp. KUL49]|uniref:hypothetical protein n=1 Tax=Alteromonas sp. KUL49 TaxID=2480798 RepID=UPI00102EEE0B|nr:hypothetical protein [Alteromonas sp. KUL49]TAP42289.1 hypothetical protein EYS00_01340 [Alteromonas sp. KUL49]GEA09895.1 hypothetical protein KUL49_02700 [Alteromonas sp. KUL49]